MAQITIFPAPKSNPVNTVLLRTIGDAPLEAPKHLIKGVLPLTGVALLSGQFAAGKTFVGIDLALSIVFNRQFIGHRVRPGGVLWIAAEGSGEIDARVAAARAGKFQDNCTDTIPLLITEPPVGLPQSSIITWLEHAIGEAGYVCSESFDAHLRLVVIDTLAACFSIADENDNAEAARLMKELARVGNGNEVLVMPIAHYGKSADTGVRGASAYGAGADAILSVLGVTDALSGKTSKRSIALTKSRRGSTGPLGSFELQTHVFGMDEDGDPITAAFVEFAAPSNDAAPRPEAKAKTKVHRDFLEAFKETLAELAKDYRIPNGPTVQAVEVSDVRQRFARRFITGKPDNSNSAMYKAFDRSISAAKEEGLISGETLSRNVALIWSLKS